MKPKTNNRSLRTLVAAVAIALACCTLARAAGESPAVVFTPDRETTLLSAIAALKDHIQGSNKLDATQIEAQKLVIDTQRDIFGSNAAIIKAACDLVAAYDKANGPLWVSGRMFTRGKGNPPANDIHWTIFNVMQAIMDNVYTAENIVRHEKLLAGFKFGCSEHFPGPVEPPTDPAAVYTVKINASYLMPFKHDIQGKSLPARRPTGAYAPPGAVVTVSVPPALAGKGYQVRIGAHSWDHKAKPNVKRLDRVSLVYAINGAEVKVASPLGGGIYIEVPLGADAGVVDVTIRNAARSPFFSATSYHKTSQAEWRDTERNLKAPWADFQSDKFLMQVPAIWIRKLDDPVTLMKDWDKAMDAATDLMGLPNVWGREVAYLQVDLQNRGSAFFPGYPTCNNGYDPNKDYGGYADNYLVRGPKFAPDYVFHEMGHGFFFTKFGGESESEVNLLHVAVWNGMFGRDLDEAFRSSFGGGNTNQTLDTTAIQWMTSLSFAAKRPMAPAEKAYQLKGHAKFVDIARLFGWKALGNFWKSLIEDDEKDVSKGRRGYSNDELSLRLSRAAGADLTPLLCFWGTPPDAAATLKAAVADAKLMPSAKIYDALLHYKSLVPADNKAFRDFALKWWGKQPSEKGFWTEREHAKQWNEYDEKTAAAIRDAAEAILAEYFPGGRPAETSNHQQEIKSMKELQQEFLKLKFGMFIHFNMETFKNVQWVAGYHSPADFNPGGKINTDAWADAAKTAGMKYAVLTVKHVSGFCLWDSKYTTYDVMNPQCPYQQDLVAQFVKSFTSRGLKVGFYYCWRSPGFGKEYKVLPPECDPATHSMKEQIEFQEKQIAELVGKFPQVFYIWNDGLDPDIMSAEEATAFVRGLRPGLLASGNWWDWGKKGTPYLDLAVTETRHFPENNTAPGETCWCLENSWFCNGTGPKTAASVVQELHTANSRNANFLLNVGPNKQGKFQDASVTVLAEIGRLLNETP